MSSQPAENEWSSCVQELHGILINALNSLGGKTTAGETNYLIFSANHFNKLIGAYIVLRKEHMVYASKTMLRSMIETVGYIVAVARQPDFLFQKVHSEFQKDKKMLKQMESLLHEVGQPTDQIKQTLSSTEKDFESFKKNWLQQSPEQTLKTGEVNFFEVLKTSGLHPWYLQYRVYSQFTHGSFRAITGGLDDMTDGVDDVLVSTLILMVLELLKNLTPAEVSNLNPYKEKLGAILTQAGL